MACSINALLTKGKLKKAGYSVQNAILIFLCVFWTKAKSRSIKMAELKNELLAIAGRVKFLSYMVANQNTGFAYQSAI